MNKNKKSQSGFSFVLILSTIILAVSVLAIGFYVFNKNSQKTKSNNSLSATPTTQKTTQAKLTYDTAGLLETAKAASTCTKSGMLSSEELVRPITSNGWAELSSRCQDSQSKLSLPGGVLAVWNYSDGSWQKKASWQGGPYCSMINIYKISTQLYPFCIIDGSTTWPKYTLSNDEKLNLINSYSYSEYGLNDNNWAKNPIQ